MLSPQAMVVAWQRDSKFRPSALSAGLPFAKWRVHAPLGYYALESDKQRARLLMKAARDDAAASAVGYSVS